MSDEAGKQLLLSNRVWPISSKAWANRPVSDSTLSFKQSPWLGQ